MTSLLLADSLLMIFLSELLMPVAVKSGMGQWFHGITIHHSAQFVFSWRQMRPTVATVIEERFAGVGRSRAFRSFSPFEAHLSGFFMGEPFAAPLPPERAHCFANSIP